MVQTDLIPVGRPAERTGSAAAFAGEAIAAKPLVSTPFPVNT